MRLTRASIFYLLIILITGCSSGGNSPVSENISDKGTRSQLDSIPVIAYDNSSALGMLGAYDLTISPDTADAELVPMRVSSIGESYVLSGASFFTSKNCLRVKSIGLDAGMRIHIVFEIRHPFEKGDPYQEPSWKNRHDLDLFDLALVILPENVPATSFDGLDADVYASVILNADGYTTELTEVIDDQAALPYKICYEDQNNNRFAMGTNWQEFDVLFAPLDSTQLAFDLYVTMGYGWSAKKDDRLHPVYYVPEFNRKPAWKVVVFSPVWVKGDIESELPVIIDVYDWNHGATVAADYPDPDHPDYISLRSDVLTVYVDIPDFEIAPVQAETQDTNFDGFENPVSFKASIANNNIDLDEGTYLGLVKVNDSRQPASAIGDADTLVHVPDSVNMEFYTLPEFATYQIFHVQVVRNNSSYGWGGSFGSVGNDVGNGVVTDDLGNVYVTGEFVDSVDFDPGDDEVWRTSNGSSDCFLLKLDKYGDFVWVYTWGGDLVDEGRGVDIYGQYDNYDIYIAGSTQNTNNSLDAFLYKFDPDGNLLNSVTWGGSSDDSARSVAVDGNIVCVTGFFASTVDFDPSSSSDQRTSNGLKDAYLVRFDTDLTYLGVGTWGGNKDDRGYDITKHGWDIYITGFFNSTVDFDPDPADVVSYQSKGDRDVFISKFKYDGDHLWTRVWGGSGTDAGNSIAYSGSNIYITGSFSDDVCFYPNIFPPDVCPPGQEHTSKGGQDIFLSKLDSSGNYIWSKTWGGLGIWDEGYGVEIADGSNVFVTGCFGQIVDFDPSDLNESIRTSCGGNDIFLSQLTTDGVFLWVNTWGTEGIWDEGHGADVGSVYITGQFSGLMDFDPGHSEDWHQSGGDTDIFLIKLKAEGVDESEPNDECNDEDFPADQIIFDEMPASGIAAGTVYGAVRETVDEQDFWSFRTGNTYGAYIYLYNDAGHNIDLFVYNEDCSVLEGSSTNPGSDPENVSLGLEPNTTYKIKVLNIPDGFAAQKDYHLYVEVYFEL